MGLSSGHGATPSIAIMPPIPSLHSTIHEIDIQIRHSEAQVLAFRSARNAAVPVGKTSVFFLVARKP